MKLREQFRNRDYVRPADAQIVNRDSQDSLELAMAALDAALDKKALDPVLLNVGELCSYTSYVLILSARSDRQVKAVAEGVARALKPGSRVIGSEGTESGQWALLDYGDIVVHVFHHPMREHYNLESLWNDAPRIQLDIPDDARTTVEDSYSH